MLDSSSGAHRVVALRAQIKRAHVVRPGADRTTPPRALVTDHACSLGRAHLSEAQ